MLTPMISADDVRDLRERNGSRSLSRQHGDRESAEPQSVFLSRRMIHQTSGLMTCFGYHFFILHFEYGSE